MGTARTVVKEVEAPVYPDAPLEQLRRCFAGWIRDTHGLQVLRERDVGSIKQDGCPFFFSGKASPKCVKGLEQVKAREEAD